MGSIETNFTKFNVDRRNYRARHAGAKSTADFINKLKIVEEEADDLSDFRNVIKFKLLRVKVFFVAVN